MCPETTDDFFDFEERDCPDPDPAPSPLDLVPPKPQDAARLAAAILLDRAIANAGSSVKAVAADGVLSVVLVGSASWSAVVRSEWRMRLRDGETPIDGYHSYGRKAWSCWMPDEPGSGSYRRRDQGEAFASAVAEGRHCLGISPDLSWLPADLVFSADHTLELPCLTAADVTAVATLLDGGAPETALTDDEAAVLTPRLLRLAHRVGQGAEAFVSKLRELIARERKVDAVAAAKEAASPRQEPTLDRLHGMDEAVAWGMAVARDVREYQAGSLAWSEVDRGCLVSGPPGCGKTLFARALAATCGVPLVSGTYAEWHGSGGAHQGDLMKAMRKTFATAKSKAPCVLFLDEVDSFPNRATLPAYAEAWETQVVNGLLAEIDGVDGLVGVVLVGACNHPEKMDPALVRSGRLDRHIRVDLPDTAALERILREHLGDDLPGQSLADAARRAAGMSGADCERVVRGARRSARTAHRPMTMQDLLDAVGGADDMSPDERWLVAVHEAGHAVVSVRLRPGALEAVTTRGNGVSGGSTVYAERDDVVRLGDVMDKLVRKLAGRAAEEVFFGEASGSCGGSPASDLATATKVAVTAASALGLDPTRRHLWTGLPTEATLPEMLGRDPRLAARVQAMLDEAYERALDLVTTWKFAIADVAAELLVRGALSGDAVAAIVARHEAAGDQT